LRIRTAVRPNVYSIIDSATSSESTAYPVVL
jgi:hypothetical protein